VSRGKIKEVDPLKANGSHRAVSPHFVRGVLSRPALLKYNLPIGWISVTARSPPFGKNVQACS